MATAFVDPTVAVPVWVAGQVKRAIGVQFLSVVNVDPQPAAC